MTAHDASTQPESVAEESIAQFIEIWKRETGAQLTRNNVQEFLVWLKYHVLK